jgi:hypothetical protein
MQQMAAGSSLSYDSLASRISVHKASLLDTLAVVGEVLLPTLAKGVIMRRPLVLGMAERLDFDRRAIQRMQRIRNKYGSGPLLLRIPGRSLALILDPQHVHVVLGNSPEPFATATKEKIAALAHFEPQGVLISDGGARADRRRYNEQVLDSHQPVHRLADGFLQTIDAETERLFRGLHDRNELTWRDFSDTWFRIVRRVVFGESASEDYELSEMMAKLRSAANWAFLAPQRPGLRDRLLRRIQTYMARADPNSLAGVMAHTQTSAITAPSQQVPQWLFAFDAAGMTIFRSLALLASQPGYAHRVRDEIAERRGSARQSLPCTQAVVLESLRMWPTTPLVLRESTKETTWATGVLPANTGILIFAPFFHRDNERLPYADRFTPELWSDPDHQQGWPLIPFSEGQAMCPGRHLVLLLAPAMIAAILDNVRLRLKNPGRLSAHQPMPGTLNHFGLRFELAARTR